MQHNNPIKQRLYQLEEQWADAVFANRETKIFCLMGQGAVDYKMVKGFFTFQMSDESNLADIFLLAHQPFKTGNSSGYGKMIVKQLQQYISEWNKNGIVREKAPEVNWQSVAHNDGATDEEIFSQNINALASALHTDEHKFYLAVALLPEPNENYPQFIEWLQSVLQAGLDEYVKLVVYDAYEMKAFDAYAKNNPDLFKYIYPDFDMTGAMGQILEQAKSTAKDPQDRASAEFQQFLLKMNSAIGAGEEREVMLYREECLRIAKRFSWPQMEAIVHFFTHGFYHAMKDNEKALTEIDLAITNGDEAIVKGLVPKDQFQYQYRIAKGNYYLINKNYEEASAVYQECLGMKQDDTDKNIVIGLYQMLGASKRMAGQKKEAWQIFEKGWQVVEEEKMEPKGNTMLMYYAKEMIDAGNKSFENYKDYINKMEGYWGPKWLHELAAFKPSLN